MTRSVLLQLIVSGLITGLIYALVSTGLTLIWGLMNLVNFAHGEYLMLAMFSAYWLSTLRHWDPLVSLPLTVVVVALLSCATYALLIRRLLTASVLAQVFATFGLMVFLQNGVQFLFGPSFRSIPNPWLEGRIRLFGTYIGQAQAVAGAGAFVTTAALYWFMRHTDLGRALDATSQDRGAAAAMGIDTNKMFLLAWAINGALLGVAGSLIASSYYVHPTVGQVFSLIAFVVVALGGFGSIEGAFIAGMLIGVFQTLCGFFLPSQIQLVPVYLLYIVIVLVRPQGLLGQPLIMRRDLVAFVAAAVGFGLILPLIFGLNVVVIDVMILVFVYASIASAWNLIGGYVGQFALSNAVFYGVGAYTSTIVSTRYGISPWLGMLLGGIAAAGVAVVIGYPCLRLGFHYFAIGTFVIGESVRLLFLSWDFIGGPLGLFIPVAPSGLSAFQFQEHLPYYYIALALMLVTVTTTYVITRSRLVFYMRAIKGDPEAAQSVGIDVASIRLRVFCLTAFLTALPGTFMAQYVLYIDPQSVLDTQISILASLLPILGGIGTVWGPVLGAVILIPLGEVTRVALGGSGRAADLVIFGGLIMVLALFRPSGLSGLPRDILGWLRRSVAEAT